jgi:3-oxosteroid 1-dehydrogenase
MNWDKSVDLVVVGSGGAAVTAALVAKRQGKTAVIIEKQAVVGGSTAYSGGILWIPCNPFVADRDSFAQARLYMDTIIGQVGPASSDARRDAYLRNGPEMIRFLQRHGLKLIDAKWEDYYSNAPGALPGGGRSLAVSLFNTDELGEWKQYLADYPGWPPLPANSFEIRPFTLAKRIWPGRLMALLIGARMAFQKLTGKHLRGSGNALQGRILQIALRESIEIMRETPLIDFVSESGRVTGVVASRAGRTFLIEAKDAVLLNTGGFSRNTEMRAKYQPQPSSTAWTQANPGDTGDAMQRAMALGAAVDLMNESWWVPGSFLPDGTFAGFHLPNDSGRPHCIVVDNQGRRFTDEAGPYMESGQRMYAAGAVPAWVIIESRHRERYPWGMMLPGKTPPEMIANGYMKKANDLDTLARQCGIDSGGLHRTVERFNRFCKTGTDEDFKRGSSAYDRSNGDPSVRPNPSLGEIIKPPFYAVALYPSDVGTAGGLLTDEHARVIREDGSVITGLYAAGNCTASVMGRCYPGAGASIGAAFVYGYVAAQHALQFRQRENKIQAAA